MHKNNYTAYWILTCQKWIMNYNHNRQNECSHNCYYQNPKIGTCNSYTIVILRIYIREANVSNVDKKNQLDVTFCIFISLLIVAQHVSGNHVPIIRS